MGRVEDKVAFITGAARGQGRSHAVRLAEEGADIIALDICDSIECAPYEPATRIDLDATIAAVEGIGRRALPIVADVRDHDAMSAALTDAVATLGRLDIVCANAAIISPARALHRMSEEAWQVMLDVNLTGVWNTCRAAVPHLLAGGRGGSIVITNSTSGLKPDAGIGNYVTAKHGLVGLAKTLAKELAHHRIRVNSVHPTQVDTPMLQNEMMYRLFQPGSDRPTAEGFEEISASLHLLPTPWLEPLDVSNAVLFLASDEARYITGASLPIDAGKLLV